MSTIHKFFVKGFDEYFNSFKEACTFIITISKQKTINLSNTYDIWKIGSDGNPSKYHTVYISPTTFIQHKTNHY